MRCWGFLGGSGAMPGPRAIAEARSRVGMHLVQLDVPARTVAFARPGVMLDLGAIGKGFAIDKAAEVLRDAGVNRALLHGGTSTIYALGDQPGGESWNVAIEVPEKPRIVSLRDESLSVSAVWGKSFEAEGKSYGHVLDPRTGEPCSHAVLAAVALPSATETDALSTALLTLGVAGQDRIAALRSGMRTWVVEREGEGRHVRCRP